MKQEHLSIRATAEQKHRWGAAAARFGMTLSEFSTTILDAVSGEAETEGWECRKIHLEGDRIVGVGDVAPVASGLPTMALVVPVIAPQRFFAALEELPFVADPSLG